MAISVELSLPEFIQWWSEFLFVLFVFVFVFFYKNGGRSWMAKTVAEVFFFFDQKFVRWLLLLFLFFFLIGS